MIERRRAIRFNFGAMAEVVDLASRRELVAVTRDLSLVGCFVTTTNPFPKGTEVRLRIMCSGADFRAIGKVTGNVTREGMGIDFVQIRPRDQAVIEKWLGLTAPGGDSVYSGAKTNPPQHVEQRRAVRYYFGGAVELTDLESGQVIVALVRALNLYGCFIKTDKSLPVGAKATLKMMHSGLQFSAMGRVVNQANDGVGVEFTDIGQADRERLNDLLATLARS